MIPAGDLLERIEQYLLDGTGDVELDDADMEAFHQVEFADRMMMKRLPNRQIVNSMLTKWPHISERTAYNRLLLMQRMYGKIRSFDKNYLRLLIIEYAKEALNMAVASKDVKAFNGALKNLILASGINQTDELELMTKLQPHINIIQFNPKEIMGEDIEDVSMIEINSLLNEHLPKQIPTLKELEDGTGEADTTL